MNIQQLFFELIQVALGVRVCLSHSPTAEEWRMLYDMAKKQSLVGVCFAGVQKLTTSTGSATEQRQEPPEMLYLTWMGMAAKIQQRNEVVNRQCVDLQKRLSADGLRSVIMKGQGVAQIYPEHLRGLRQSGDIDVWVLSNEGESDSEHIARIVKYAKGFDSQSHFSGKHIDLSVFSDTEVELHVTLAKMNCPKRNRCLQKWFQKESLRGFQNVNSFNVPQTEFNLVYLLLHCYDHLLFEGVGLRQIMDYYFVLHDYKMVGEPFESTKTIKTPEGSAPICDDEIENNTSTSSANRLSSSSSQTSADSYAVTFYPSGKKQKKQLSLIETISELGLGRFASAMMWVLKEAFGLEEQYMICEPNEKEGRFLLNEIMTGGNFGKYGKDGVMEGHAKGKVAFFLARMKRNWRFLTHYPSEVLWAPYAMLRHWMWKRTVKI